MKVWHKNPFFYLNLFLVLVIAFSAWGFVEAQEGSPSSRDFPGSDLAPPINLSDNPQTKSGSLVIKGSTLEVGESSGSSELEVLGSSNITLGPGGLGMKEEEGGDIKNQPYWSYVTGWNKSDSGDIYYGVSGGENNVGLEGRPSAKFDTKGSVGVGNALVAYADAFEVVNKGLGERHQCPDGYAVSGIAVGSGDYNIRCAKIDGSFIDSTYTRSIKAGDDNEASCFSDDVVVGVKMSTYLDFNDNRWISSLDTLFCQSVEGGVDVQEPSGGDNFANYKEECPRGTFAGSVKVDSTSEGAWVDVACTGITPGSVTADAGDGHNLNLESHEHSGAKAYTSGPELSSYEWVLEECPNEINNCSSFNESGSISGSYSSIEGPTYTPPECGTYKWRLTAEDEAGNSGSDTMYEVVEARENHPSPPESCE